LDFFISLQIQDYTAKLSDFGLAKDGPEGEETHVTTRVMGTHGYAAPEYIMTGMDTTIWNVNLVPRTSVTLVCDSLQY